MLSQKNEQLSKLTKQIKLVLALGVQYAPLYSSGHAYGHNVNF